MYSGSCISPPFLILLQPFTNILTLKVLVVTIDAQWAGMGDVGSASYEPALLPPCPTIRVLTGKYSEIQHFKGLTTAMSTNPKMLNRKAIYSILVIIHQSISTQDD